MKIGYFVRSSMAIDLLNGKMKVNYGISTIIGVVMMVLFFIGSCFMFFVGLVNLNLEVIVLSIISISCFGYLFLISPYTQKSSNYYIEFQSNDSLENFKLSYKGKLVNFKYKIDDDGKFVFANNSSKLSCISYADGTQMSNFVKYKIINYFTKWLFDKKLLSSETTKTFEE